MQSVHDCSKVGKKHLFHTARIEIAAPVVPGLLFRTCHAALAANLLMNSNGQEKYSSPKTTDAH